MTWKLVAWTPVVRLLGPRMAGVRSVLKLAVGAFAVRVLRRGLLRDAGSGCQARAVAQAMSRGGVRLGRPGRGAAQRGVAPAGRVR
ncbi:hypothetical protein [Streptomyces sp. NRRL S-1448]|uniref:hypothetical protein n=1 Tax=Streptomyces sp. NRRL S-1448 TaxID=1463883 RepID=UPI0005608B15|nr:hypothetical protein [Streptomyces sp. NRRL S-1448]